MTSNWHTAIFKIYPVENHSNHRLDCVNDLDGISSMYSICAIFCRIDIKIIQKVRFINCAGAIGLTHRFHLRGHGG